MIADYLVTGRKVASYSEAGLTLHLVDGTTVLIPKHEVLGVHGSCASYMKAFGAWDEQGREVVWNAER